MDFLNQVIAHVRAKGFQVRVWNDGLFRPDLQTEEEVMDRCRDSLRAFSVRCWGWKNEE